MVDFWFLIFKKFPHFRILYNFFFFKCSNVLKSPRIQRLLVYIAEVNCKLPWWLFSHCSTVALSQDLSIALYEHFLQDQPPGSDSSKKIHLLGFDLDQNLILRAQNSNPFPQNIQFISLDITSEGSHTELASYLQKFGRSRFHLCSCFAVTMWVHLNHGDAALLAFLSRLASIGECLLLEAQPWKCYRSAARRFRKLGRSDFDHFKTLEIRGDMAAHAKEHLEKQCGMELVQSFGSTSWDRSLLLFKRRWYSDQKRKQCKLISL